MDLNAIVQGVLVAGVLSCVGLLVRVMGNQSEMKATLDHPETGIAARMTLLAQRVHDNANHIIGATYEISALKDRVTKLEEGDT